MVGGNHEEICPFLQVLSRYILALHAYRHTVLAGKTVHASNVGSPRKVTQASRVAASHAACPNNNRQDTRVRYTRTFSGHFLVIKKDKIERNVETKDQPACSLWSLPAPNTDAKNEQHKPGIIRFRNVILCSSFFPFASCSFRGIMIRGILSNSIRFGVWVGEGQEENQGNNPPRCASI